MKNLLIAVLVMLCIILGGLAFKGSSSSEKNIESTEGVHTNLTIKLAKQHGMQYATVYVAEKMGLLEKYLPGAKVEWSSFGGGAAITEALVSGHLDVGFMGIPPVLVAWDKGSTMKIALGVNVPPFDLMVKDSRIKSIADFQATDKIAVPGIGSTQQILLSMGAKKYLGDARKLDTNIVAMANPDAYSSILSGTEVVGHFTTMPYLEMERKEGFKSILSGKDAFGDASIVCVTSKSFHDNNPSAYAALITALSEAADLINQKDERAVNIIAETEKISKEDALTYLNWNGTNYTTNIYGLLGLAEYMKEAGYIKNIPTLNDILWENARAMVGQRVGEKSAVEGILDK